MFFPLASDISLPLASIHKEQRKNCLSTKYKELCRSGLLAKERRANGK